MGVFQLKVIIEILDPLQSVISQNDDNYLFMAVSKGTENKIQFVIKTECYTYRWSLSTLFSCRSIWSSVTLEERKRAVRSCEEVYTPTMKEQIQALKRVTSMDKTGQLQRRSMQTALTGRFCCDFETVEN